MRLAAATALLDQGFVRLRSGAAAEELTLAILLMGAAVLLLVGLWTPVAGVAAALAELWNGLSPRGDPLIFILIGTLGVALALLGPGCWSVDARLFGWKRIDFRDRRPE